MTDAHVKAVTTNYNITPRVDYRTVLDVEGPLVALDDVQGEGEAEARSRLLRVPEGALGRVEGIEDAQGILRRDPGTVVLLRSQRVHRELPFRARAGGGVYGS